MLEKNPWLSIWTRPRETIRTIISEGPNRSLWLLAAIYGFSSLLNSFQSVGLGSWMGAFPIFILALVLSPIWGYVVFGVWSWVVCWTGKWLKGQGNFQHVRAAYSWSCVPLTISAILWVVMIGLFGGALFAPGEHLLTEGAALFLFVILLVKVVLAIWSLVIYLNTLAEVQQFSILRSVGNVVISGVILGIVLAIVWTVIMYMLGVPVDPAQTALLILPSGGL